MKKLFLAAGLVLALAAVAPAAALADGLSSRSVQKVVKAMEDVAGKVGPAALSTAGTADPATLKVLRKHGFSAGEWQDRYGRVLSAYRSMQADPSLVAMAEAAAEQDKGSGGLFGDLLSSDNLSSLGNAALFGGGDGLKDMGARIAIDQAATAAGDALGDDSGSIAAVGSAAAHGGMDAAKMAGAQIAIDGAAGAVSSAVTPGRSGGAATDPGLLADVATVAPYQNRIRQALGG